MSAAMATAPGCFPPHYRALVRAGERGGNLGRVLQRFAETSRADRTDASRAQDAIYLVSQLAAMCSVLMVIRVVSYVLVKVAVQAKSKRFLLLFHLPKRGR